MCTYMRYGPQRSGIITRIYALVKDNDGRSTFVLIKKGRNFFARVKILLQPEMLMCLTFTRYTSVKLLLDRLAQSFW